MQGLKNIMEDAVESQLNKLLVTMPNICSCENCKLDMASYALNRLSPQYVRTDKGEIIQKVNNYSQQVEVEILTVTMQAINKVGNHPQHK